MEEAKLDAVEATLEDREVRVLDGGDLLVFHTKDGEIIYGEDFWETIAD